MLQSAEHSAWDKASRASGYCQDRECMWVLLSKALANRAVAQRFRRPDWESMRVNDFWKWRFLRLLYVLKVLAWDRLLMAIRLTEWVFTEIRLSRLTSRSCVEIDIRGDEPHGYSISRRLEELNCKRHSFPYRWSFFPLGFVFGCGFLSRLLAAGSKV